jgi:two-component system sensor histidine kinase KdpD
VDIHVVGGADEAAVLRGTFLARSRAYLQPGRSSEKVRWRGYALGVSAMAVCTLLGMAMTRSSTHQIVMVYLLAVAIVAARFGRGPAVLASVLGVAAFDFFFVPPQLTFAFRRAVSLTFDHAGRRTADFKFDCERAVPGALRDT